ncbi:hypothetical protein A2U01_0103289, partial [Trifolium medium]|nr:hypothetical protein [Trifolium medium]
VAIAISDSDKGYMGKKLGARIGKVEESELY